MHYTSFLLSRSVWPRDLLWPMEGEHMCTPATSGGRFKSQHTIYHISLSFWCQQPAVLKTMPVLDQADYDEWWSQMGMRTKLSLFGVKSHGSLMLLVTTVACLPSHRGYVDQGQGFT